MYNLSGTFQQRFVFTIKPVNWLSGLLLIALIACIPVALAAPNSPTFPDTEYNANLTAGVVAGTNDHVLNWAPYTEINVFGYDVYYGREPLQPGENANRISTGAKDGQWIDVDGKLNGRCEPSAYFVVAYNRGRKAYSAPAQGSGANLCNAADEIAPVVSVTQPEDGQEYTGTAVFSGLASDAGGSGVSYVSVEITGPGTTGASIERRPTLTDGNWVTTVVLEQGTYLLTVFAEDVSGNQSAPVFVDFSVIAAAEDTTSPLLILASPVQNQVFTSAQQLIEGSIDDSGGSGVASVMVDISGTKTPVLTVADSWSLSTNLPGGNYQLKITASDRAGNPAVPISRSFSVDRTSVIGEDGYNDTQACVADPMQRPDSVVPDIPPTFENMFDSDQDIYTQLQENWKSSYEWRDSTSDVIINNESQFYLDVLGYDAKYRDTWSPFELLRDSANNGYLAINAAKAEVLNEGPTVNGSTFAGQDYLSGVLTTYGKHSLSPNNSPNGKVVIELRAKMPRGQGVFPAAWLYNDSFFRNNPEIDIFEYIGQSPDADSVTGWKIPGAPECGTPCLNAGRQNYNTFHTQYHGVYISEKGKLVGTGGTSVDDSGDPTGSIYSNPDGSVWWRDTWGCTIDFSDKFHIYTLEWSAEEIVWYIDDIVVFRLDEQADSGGNLPRVNFVPNDTRSMYLTLNFALGSAASYIGAPDDYTKDSMDAGDLRYIIDYIKVWE